jgi:hypothetical protein
MTKPFRGLDLLEDNLRRLRAVNIAVTAVGVVLSRSQGRFSAPGDSS